MRYTLTNHTGSIEFESDSIDDVAERLGVKAQYLYVRLSAGKGEWTKGKGQSLIVLTDAGRGSTKVGPTKQAWQYWCTYPDAEFGEQMPWAGSHHLTADELQVLLSVAYQKLAPTTVDQRLTGGLKLMIPIPKNFTFNSAVIYRLPADKTLPDDANGRAAFDKLIKKYESKK